MSFGNINSLGGSVSAVLAIYDTMRNNKAPVHTIGVGMAASMTSLILEGDNKRSILLHSKVMIHQPLIASGIESKKTNISKLAKNLSSTRWTIAEIVAKHTGKTIKAIEGDIENDKYMSAEEAVKYGLCDKVIAVA